MNTKNDLLNKILSHKYKEVKKKQSSASLEQLAADAKQTDIVRPFFSHVLSCIENNGIAVIAEIKKASPDSGVFRKEFEPESLAGGLASAGASCLSVSTDSEFYQGDDSHIQMAKQACSLPVIRNDFIVDPWQVYESRCMGADAIILIAAALKASQLRTFSDIAVSLGMDVLVEVHNREELERAHVLRSPLISINNRDPESFTTSIDTTLGLLHDVFPDRTVISSGGIHTEEELRKLKRAGVNAFMIGERLLKADDPGAELRQFLS